MKAGVHRSDLERVLNQYDYAGYDLYSIFQQDDKFILLFIDPEDC